MPLLLCPNDNGSMQTVKRSGVEFDICPTCRGVWLDRGELEKLLEAGREDSGGRETRRDRSFRDEHKEPRDRDDDDDRGFGGRGRGSIFDIFD